MAPIVGGVRFTGFVAPSDTADTYPVTDPLYAIGGYREVADLTARDAITAQRRRAGMLVYVQSNDTIYVLKDGIDNTNWTILTSGGVPAIPATEVPFGSSSNLLVTSPNFIWNDANQFLQVPALVLTQEPLGLITAGKVETNGIDLYFSPTVTNRYKVLLQKYLGNPYVVTNGVDLRAFNANNTTLDALADVVATIISDLQQNGILQ